MSRKRLAFLLAIASGILWSTQGFFIRRLNTFQVYDLQITAVRYLVTLVLLLAIILIRRPSLLRIHLRDLPAFLITGAVGMVAMNYLYYKTIEMTTLSFAVGLCYTSPAFVLVLSLPVFHERITADKGVALLLTLLGCLFLSGMVGAGGGGSVSATSVAMGLGAGLTYAMCSVFTRFALNKGYSPLTVTFYTFLFAGLGCSCICDFRQIATAATSYHISLWYMLGMAIVCTIIPSTLYTISLKYLPASLGSMLVSVELVSACLLGFVVFGEVLTLPDVMGICLILAAVLLLGVFGLREQRKRQSSVVRSEVGRG